MSDRVLKFHRPFSFINSRITAYDPLDPSSSGNVPSYVTPDKYRIIGECQQQWHLLRRKYNLFLYQDKTSDATNQEYEPEAGGRGGVYTQFAYVDEPFLSWYVGRVSFYYYDFDNVLCTGTSVSLPATSPLS
jgi:hypothetical protein